MEAHRIAVLSDTHGLLRPEVIDTLKTCEVILHAGDIHTPEVLARLNAIAPTYAVRGNVDKEWAERLPTEFEAELFGFRIYMVHNKKHIRKDLSGLDVPNFDMSSIGMSSIDMSSPDIVICGHSHKYEESTRGGIVYLNPGSCGPRRFHLPVTMMVLVLYPSEHRMVVMKINCASEELSKDSRHSEMLLSDKDMYRLVKTVIKEVDAGRAVEDIAARNHVDRELAEQICRMYLTHPGVTAEGILDRMERKNL